MDEILFSIRGFSAFPVGGLLALNTVLSPWQGCQTLRTNLRLAFHAGTESALLNPSQGSFHMA
jgi:hypothetical protein